MTAHRTPRSPAPRPAALPTATAREARARLRRLVRDRRGSVLVLLLLTALSTAGSVAGPALIGVVVDAALEQRSTDTVYLAAAIYAALTVVAAGIRYVADLRAAGIGESALAELREEVFVHAVGMSTDDLERAGAGDLISRVTDDTTVLARAVRYTVPRVVFAGVEVVLIVAALAVVEPRLAAAALVAGAPAALLGGRWYFRHAPTRYRHERETQARLAGSVLEVVRGRVTLIGHNAADRFRLRTALTHRQLLDAHLATTDARNRLRPAVSLALACALVSVIALGSGLVEADAASVGTVSAAALYVVRLFDPVAVLLEETDEIQVASAATARLVGITSMPTMEPVRRADAARVGRVDLDLRGIDFAYQEGRPVLVDLTLTVPAGQRLVVVGPSGAGKTTLGRLICGSLHPDGGAVRFGGEDLDALPPDVLARTVAMVPQEGHVFARSVADNVRIGDPGADDETVAGALEVVGALAWVRALPQGLHTKVGSGGFVLSPPRSQQIGLARLVCANPAVVVLDEATADLDPAGAARTERHLAAALAGRTVVSIAHRLDAAARADRVLVLDHGRIVEDGRHEDLLASGGLYARMWERWRADRGA